MNIKELKLNHQNQRALSDQSYIFKIVYYLLVIEFIYILVNFSRDKEHFNDKVGIENKIIISGIIRNWEVY